MGKKKLATAIGYKSGDYSPRLLVSGRGKNAEKIIGIAKGAGITVVEDSSLAVLLDTWAGGNFVKSGDYIPPWCWEATAKILAFVFKTGQESKV